MKCPALLSQDLQAGLLMVPVSCIRTASALVEGSERVNKGARKDQKVCLTVHQKVLNDTLTEHEIPLDGLFGQRTDALRAQIGVRNGCLDGLSGFDSGLGNLLTGLFWSNFGPVLVLTGLFKDQIGEWSGVTGARHCADRTCKKAVAGRLQVVARRLRAALWV
jgi:hypothetical protein